MSWWGDELTRKWRWFGNLEALKIHGWDKQYASDTAYSQVSLHQDLRLEMPVPCIVGTQFVERLQTCPETLSEPFGYAWL